MTITSELPMRAAAAITGDGVRCVLCDRMWPKDEMPLWHTWIIRATEPIMDCSCDGTHEEPRWHAFEVLNHRGCLNAAGIVCPQCVTTRGLGTAAIAACFKVDECPQEHELAREGELPRGRRDARQAN